MEIYIIKENCKTMTALPFRYRFEGCDIVDVNCTTIITLIQSAIVYVFNKHTGELHGGINDVCNVGTIGDNYFVAVHENDIVYVR